MNANEMLAGEGTLARAAGMVADAKVEFDQLSAGLSDRIMGAQGRWQGAGGSAFFGLHQAWTDKQKVIVAALNEFEANLRGTQSANLATDDNAMSAQNANLHRLGGIQS